MHPIAFYRKAKGWTQTDLADLAGVSITSVQAWERGLGPRPRNLPKLADLFSVDAQTLLREIESWRRDSRGEASSDIQPTRTPSDRQETRP